MTTHRQGARALPCFPSAGDAGEALGVWTAAEAAWLAEQDLCADCADQGRAVGATRRTADEAPVCAACFEAERTRRKVA